MRDLTEEKALGLISKNVADFTNPIFLYIPSTKFEQPFIMYQSRNYGHTKDYLSNDIKLSFDAGMYKHSPKQKPFDITKHEFSDYSVCVDYLGGSNRDYLVVETSVNMPVILNKSDAIAMAKSLGATGEDLK